MEIAESGDEKATVYVNIYQWVAKEPANPFAVVTAGEVSADGKRGLQLGSPANTAEIITSPRRECDVERERGIVPPTGLSNQKDDLRVSKSGTPVAASSGPTYRSINNKPMLRAN